MNIRKGKAEFKNVRILLDSGCSSKIVMIRLISKLNPKEDAMVLCHKQAANITTNLKVKTYFTLPEFSTTKILIWDCHVDDYAKVRYAMILGRYLLKHHSY